MDDQLRERVARMVCAFKGHETGGCRFTAPEPCSALDCATVKDADAIMEIIREERVKVLRNAERPRITDDVVADAFADHEWMESDPLRLLDDICNYAQDMIDPGTVGRRPWNEIDIIIMGRIYKMAEKAHTALTTRPLPAPPVTTET